MEIILPFQYKLPENTRNFVRKMQILQVSAKRYL